MKKLYLILISLLCAASFGISWYIYPSLPEMVAIHWGVNGSADGFANSVIGAFLMPALMVIISLVLIYIPNLDPMKKIGKRLKMCMNILSSEW